MLYGVFGVIQIETVPVHTEKDHHAPIMSLYSEHFSLKLLWPPYGIGQAIIFFLCGFFYLLSFFPSLNLSRRRLDVCHTSTHDVALV